jgi:dTDP-4-dehydrorhamnose reductase
VSRQASGLFHIGGGTPISWYDFAAMIFRIAGVKPELRVTNEREYRTPARRPKYSALQNARIAQLGLEPMPPLEEALRDYMQRTGRGVAVSG